MAVLRVCHHPGSTAAAPGPELGQPSEARLGGHAGAGGRPGRPKGRGQACNRPPRVTRRRAAHPLQGFAQGVARRPGKGAWGPRALSWAHMCGTIAGLLPPQNIQVRGRAAPCPAVTPLVGHLSRLKLPPGVRGPPGPPGKVSSTPLVPGPVSSSPASESKVYTPAGEASAHVCAHTCTPSNTDTQEPWQGGPRPSGEAQAAPGMPPSPPTPTAASPPPPSPPSSPSPPPPSTPRPHPPTPLNSPSILTPPWCNPFPPMTGRQPGFSGLEGGAQEVRQPLSLWEPRGRAKTGCWGISLPSGRRLPPALSSPGCRGMATGPPLHWERPFPGLRKNFRMYISVSAKKEVIRILRGLAVTLRAPLSPRRAFRPVSRRPAARSLVSVPAQGFQLLGEVTAK